MQNYKYVHYVHNAIVSFACACSDDVTLHHEQDMTEEASAEGKT